MYPKIFPLISQRITLNPQVCFHPIPGFELSTFQENQSQGKNGQKHTEKSNFDFYIKSSFNNYISSRHEIGSSKNQKSEITLKKNQFSKHLENFLSVKRI